MRGEKRRNRVKPCNKSALPPLSPIPGIGQSPRRSRAIRSVRKRLDTLPDNKPMLFEKGTWTASRCGARTLTHTPAEKNFPVKKATRNQRNQILKISNLQGRNITRINYSKEEIKKLIINQVSPKGPGKFPTVEGQGRKLLPIVA